MLRRIVNSIRYAVNTTAVAGSIPAPPAMELIQIKRMANALMAEHGLIDKGWKFVFDRRARRRLGQCRYYKKEIGISTHLAALASDFGIKDTILHEIAHALVGHEHGHDEVWRAKAIEIGCSGNQYYSYETHFTGGASSVAKQSKYSLQCPSCNRLSPIHRRPKRRKSCGACYPPAFNPNYELKLIQNY